MAAAAVQIGEAARRAALSVDTIRYYERRALLPAPARTLSGYRHYTAGDIQRLRLIRRLQSLGFTLREVAALTGSGGAGETACAHVRNLLQAKLAEVRARQRALDEMERELRTRLGACERELRQPDRRRPCGCPALQDRP
ncbi:MAG TPA: MerR family transcriptional regulator [Terriglobales bacterium]|nr:MerR family transcriptional regulator [Terriglobales bacterium]